MKRIFLLFVILFLLLLYLIFKLPSQYLKIHFFYVGQGDGVLIETPENYRILIDGGPDLKILEKLSEVLSYDQKTINLAILTHPHADHLNGLVEVMEKYQIENLLLTGVDYSSLAYDRFWQIIEQKGINLIFVDESFDLKIGSLLIDLLFPENHLAGKKFGNLNNSSIAFRVIFGEQKILFSGDLELEGENWLIDQKLNLGADVYKVAHHGSKTSSSLEFLTLIKPSIAVISCGINNQFKHPTQVTLDSLRMLNSTVYRTDLDGDILIELNGLDLLKVKLI